MRADAIYTAPRLHRSDYLGLASASAAVLALQVTATRLFSFLVWYHFSFLVLSIAFLGFTAGGMLAGRGPATSAADIRKPLVRFGFAAGITTLAAFFTLSRLPLEPYLLASSRAALLFIVIIAVTVIPFIFLGAYVCRALALWPERIGALYAVNLGGSAAGCALVVLLLDWLGVPAAFLATGLLAFASGLCTLPWRSLPRLSSILGAAVVVAWLFIIYGATHQLSPWVYLRSSKIYPQVPREFVADRRSDSLSTVDIFWAPPDMKLTLWGISPHYKRPPPETIGFAIDGWALTSIFKRSDIEVPDSVLEYLPATVPYRLHPARRALVIGAGGGVDVATALYKGVKQVVAAEINPIILNSVKHTYADFAGHLYSDRRVEIHRAEGRHFLKRDRRKYDIIQLSGVDTFAASQAGAFALHENYLYTVEAVRNYLSALEPDGILTFTRWLYTPERQTIRLAAIVDQVLRERGATRPQNHLAVFASELFSVTIIKNNELTTTEVAQLRSDVEAKGFDLVYSPYVRVNPRQASWGDNPFYKLWDLGPKVFVDQYPLDIRPTTDDRPFFFEYQRWGRALARDMVFDAQNAQIVLLETFGVCAVLCVLMLWVARRRYRDVPARLGTAAHVYFAVLGLGYIFVENVLVQRVILFLGTPSHALTIILFSLLTASGLGSAVATRVGAFRQRAPLCMLGVAVLLVVYSFALRPTLDRLMWLELEARIPLVIVAIAPLGFLMGIPFPLAIRKLSSVDATLLPRAWVVNGAASVLGSIVTMMLAMTSGFSAVFWAAAALYVCAAATYPRLVATRQPV